MSAPPGPLLLVGPQRSGTTALGAALSAAVAAAGGCFTVNGKLPYLLRRWWTPADVAAAHLRADEAAHALARVPPYGDGAGAWLGRARAALLAGARRAADGRAAPTVAEEARRICAEAYAAEPWGDKYNEYLLDLPWLDAVFPDARWIFLVRDPAETVASMLAWPRDKPWNPAHAAAASAKWAHWASRWLEFRARVPPERRCELDYADLCDGRAEGLAELVGVETAPFLTGLRRSAADRPRPPLGPRALDVRAALARLRILGEPAGTTR
ncbi:sulfotransferase [Actinomadura atramentaria]|uniref:sulfotransferase n=1 Tax=Actinomadura atramentaria TaxID=1990 RepID=UPI00037DED4C|nr:sulfotransferase [Actinomadura atramentaria]